MFRCEHEECKHHGNNHHHHDGNCHGHEPVTKTTRMAVESPSTRRTCDARKVGGGQDQATAGLAGGVANSPSSASESTIVSGSAPNFGSSWRRHAHVTPESYTKLSGCPPLLAYDPTFQNLNC